MSAQRQGIYLDHAATTPLDDAVLEAMLPYLTDVYGNPSSLHRVGRLARRGVETAREQVAAVLGVRPALVTFTSGATEADDLAIRGVMARRPGALVTSQVEHAAVLGAARMVNAAGREVEYLQPTPAGEITVAAVREALAAVAERAAAGEGGAALVALMHVNNETGVRTDVAATASAAHEAGALYLSDAVQAVGLEDVAVGVTGADLVTISAHKLNGPKGAGALVRREGVELDPVRLGGEQERGVRPGTHAVSAIVGLGAAITLAESRRLAERRRLADLQRRLEAALCAVGGVELNGAGADRSVKHVNVRVAGVDGEALLMALDDAGVYVSAGSACAAGSLEPSHVLLAMGLDAAAARASVRFSLGTTTTVADVDEAALRFAAVVERCRAAAAG